MDYHISENIRELPHHKVGTLGFPDGVELRFKWWEAPDPKADVVLVHGYSEHYGRYAHVAEYLNSLGYSMWSVDFHGHGTSPGMRGYVNRIDDYVGAVHALIRGAKKLGGRSKFFLLGHSMGGLIAALAGLKYQQDITGIVLTAPALKVDHLASPLVVSIGKFLSQYAPKLGVAPPVDPKWISRDPAVVESYGNDPLVYRGKIKARPGYEIILGSRYFAANASKFTLPLLVLQGGADRVIPPSGLDMIFPAIGSSDKTVRLFPECYHEILQEPEKMEALKIISDWLDIH